MSDVMDLICGNCGYRLGEHYCNHPDVYNHKLTGTIAIVNGHACPVENSQDGELISPKPYGVNGWFRNLGDKESLPATKSVQTTPSKEIDTDDWKAWRHNVPGECACGIPRQKCDYHK